MFLVEIIKNCAIYYNPLEREANKELANFINRKNTCTCIV